GVTGDDRSGKRRNDDAGGNPRDEFCTRSFYTGGVHERRSDRRGRATRYAAQRSTASSASGFSGAEPTMKEPHSQVERTLESTITENKHLANLAKMGLTLPEQSPS